MGFATLNPPKWKVDLLNVLAGASVVGIFVFYYSYFAYLISDGKYFTGSLVSQDFSQITDNIYQVNQMFEIRPWHLMECDTVNRTVLLDDIPQLGSEHNLFITPYCYEGYYYYHEELANLSVFLFIGSFIIGLCLALSDSSKILLDKFITIYICCILIMISMYALHELTFYFNSPSYPLSGKVYNYTMEIELNSKFEYCQRVEGYITNDYIICPNVSYYSHCFSSYDLASEISVNPHVSFTTECKVSEPPMFPYFSVIFISLIVIICNLLSLVYLYSVYYDL